jgi:hypothetical protein
MKNIGFAQRVTVKRINDPYRDKPDNNLRLQVQKEINSNPLIIDRACFQKTQEERDYIKGMKKLNRMNNSFFQQI